MKRDDNPIIDFQVFKDFAAAGGLYESVDEMLMYDKLCEETFEEIDEFERENSCYLSTENALQMRRYEKTLRKASFADIVNESVVWSGRTEGDTSAFLIMECKHFVLTEATKKDFASLLSKADKCSVMALAAGGIRMGFEFDDYYEMTPKANDDQEN